MQIELSKIKVSPSPVRTSWDEEKMEELVQSIQQNGLLQAIKVRPKGDEYEIVYGHRRVEAHHRLGLRYIEATVEELDDNAALIQALIENLQREDLSAMDKARGLKELKDLLGFSNALLAARLGIKEDTLRLSIALLQEPLQIQSMITTKPGKSDPVRENICNGTPPPAKVTAKHVRLVRESGLPENARVRVLKKAATEGLTAKQTRELADAYKDAQTPRAREIIMELPAVQVGFVKKAAREVAIHEKDEEKSWWNTNASEGAKNLVRRIRVDREGWNKAWLIVERGAIGPEHMPYIEKRLRSLGNLLIKRADELNERREKAVQKGTDND